MANCKYLYNGICNSTNKVKVCQTNYNCPVLNQIAMRVIPFENDLKWRYLNKNGEEVIELCFTCNECQALIGSTLPVPLVMKYKENVDIILGCPGCKTNFVYECTEQVFKIFCKEIEQKRIKK